MDNQLLSPLADDVFKGIFADRRNIGNLAAFLRPIVRLPDEEFSRLSLVDPFLKRLFKKDKQGVLDVKVLTTSGKVINVEVQVGHFTAIRNRILYYLAKLIWEQLRSGDHYDRIQQVIILLICDQLIPGEPGLSGLTVPDSAAGTSRGRGGYLNSFVLREEGGGEIFTHLIKIITLELPKVPREKVEDEVWPWARFFTCKGEEEYNMLGKEYPEVGKVVGELKKLSWGERRRLIAEQEEIWRKDRASMANDARNEGLEAGRKIGLKVGQEAGLKEGIIIGTERAHREKVEAARRLKAKGVPTDLIAGGLDLPLETVESL
jgi:hypothetical protein